MSGSRVPPAAAAFVAAALAATACGGVSPPPRVGPPAGPALTGASAAPAPEEGAQPAPGTSLEPRPFPEPPGPWFFPEIRVTPTDPGEGEVVGIRVRPAPGGRGIAEVRGELGGRPVHFARLGDEWLGLAALPPGVSGARLVQLRFVLPDGSTVTDGRYLRVSSRRYPSSRLSVDPRFSRPPAEVLSRIREERELVRETLSRVTPRWLASGGFHWPRRTRITSPFGVRRVFNGELRSRHWGVDLAGDRGEPVRAAARGRVALVRSLYFAGNAVYLDHGLGVYTAYFHLSRTDVRQGEPVRAGQLVGRVGATGRVTGPHLHWSLYVNGVHLDARSLLRLDLPDPDAATRRAR